MGKHTHLACLFAAGLCLTGCTTVDPRLRGTWKSNKVPMPVEMVKVTKMETVPIRKGSRKTKLVPKILTVAKTQSAPEYLDLVLKYERSYLVIEFPSKDGVTTARVSLPYAVTVSGGNSLLIDVSEPASGKKGRIEISFDGPNRFWVNPAGGEGWKEYYERVEKRG